MGLPMELNLSLLIRKTKVVLQDLTSLLFTFSTNGICLSVPIVCKTFGHMPKFNENFMYAAASRLIRMPAPQVNFFTFGKIFSNLSISISLNACIFFMVISLCSWSVAVSCSCWKTGLDLRALWSSCWKIHGKQDNRN